MQPRRELVDATLVHHANPSGVSQRCRVELMHDCNSDKLLVRAAFMHHDDTAHNVQPLKGLNQHADEMKRYCDLWTL